MLSCGALLVEVGNWAWALEVIAFLVLLWLSMLPDVYHVSKPLLYTLLSLQIEPLLPSSEF